MQTCGSLFDVISIHRYPFEAAVATLPAAKADAANFRQTINSVRGILQATGQAGKPLALTEMNVAYDATSCVLGASPATVGGALWLADALGAAIELGLWTSAVWDISDDEVWALGLIGSAPGHMPRPAYYAYRSTRITSGRRQWLFRRRPRASPRTPAATSRGTRRRSST